MKNIYRLAGTCLLGLTILSTGCSSEPKDEVTPVVDTTENASFTAVISEDIADSGTRASYGSTGMTFDNGDQLFVARVDNVTLNTFTLESLSEPKKGTFTGTISNPSDVVQYFGGYPLSAELLNGATIGARYNSLSGKTFYIPVSDKQSYVADGFTGAPMVFYGEEQGTAWDDIGEVNFVQVGTVFRIPIKVADKDSDKTIRVTKIEFSAADKVPAQAVLAGLPMFKVGEVNELSGYTGSSGSAYKSIELNCKTVDSPKGITVTGQSLDFHIITVPFQITQIPGVKIVISYTVDADAAVKTLTVSNATTLNLQRRGTIVEMPVITIGIADEGEDKSVFTYSADNLAPEAGVGVPFTGETTLDGITYSLNGVERDEAGNFLFPQPLAFRLLNTTPFPRTLKKVEFTGCKLSGGPNGQFSVDGLTWVNSYTATKDGEGNYLVEARDDGNDYRYFRIRFIMNPMSAETVVITIAEP